MSSHYHYAHTRLRVHWAPAIPTPFDLKGGTFLQTSRETHREIVKSYLVVIARSEATKQSTLSLLLCGILDPPAGAVIGLAKGETRWRG